jgi:flagellar protein FlaD
LLEYLNSDYASVVLVMRWIEFLFERINRNKIAALLDYYEDIGWISAQVKPHIMAYARGEIQDVTAYEPAAEDSMAPIALEEDKEQLLEQESAEEQPGYRPGDDWKLPAEDHLKSLLFIKKMAGCRIDKDELNSLEQEIKVMKYSLRRYHEV